MDFLTVCRRLEAGEIRVAEKLDGRWKVNTWIKEAILEGFRIGKLKDWSEGEYSFFDKDTLPLRRFALEDRCVSFREAAVCVAGRIWRRR